MKVRRLMFCVLLVVVPLCAQTHFLFTSNTGANATVGVPAAIAPTINGIPIAVGDEIGAFSPGGLCVGAAAWTGFNIAITVWGDNNLTATVDGIVPGETILYRIWGKAASKEFSTVNGTYSLGNGIFAVNGLYALASLEAVLPLPAVPTLLQPVNGAVNVSPGVTLQWNPAAGAVNYLLLVSPDSLFERSVDQSFLNATSRKLDSLRRGWTYYWRVRGENSGGAGKFSSVFHFIVDASVTIAGLPYGVPDIFALGQNYPNPFNPSTTIRFSLPDARMVRLAVYDVLGREVSVLVNEYLPQGVYRVVWNADGRESGMYVYHITAGGYAASRTMILMK